MNKTKLKNYAPQARKDFIAAVSARANQLGLSTTGSGLVVSPAIRQGDVTLIEGRDWPAKVYGQRERLVKRMQREGFDQTVEAVAYTWFNRFAALRYMELHDYLEHGYRVLSSIGNESGTAGTPDILLHAVDLAQSQNLPGLNADEVGRLKLAGNQDGELYRKLLIAQCNALSNAMPFLFERIDDETELLLPDNLLRTDSVIAKLISEIQEEDWQEVEVIGWLYQFYISEKKDQVIGKVVKSEDIPAATQLFTPNWIVKYMVQNSVGRLWMMANPESSLKSQWEYYIEPAEQTPEVNAQLDALIKTRMDEDGGSLNPETITVLDPACGSGHILVEAYELLKGIYLERGYRLRDIPRLILEKNLYGLDIDDRAAQMAGFALLMKARADDRRLLNESPKLNVLSLQESKGVDLDELSTHLTPFGIQRGTIKSLIDTFEHAKTFGSLIQIPDVLNALLMKIADLLVNANEVGDLYGQASAQDLLALVRQAVVLGMNFDAVVANPPYMGGKFYCPLLKSFILSKYEPGKSDIYGAFVLRNIRFANQNGFIGMITIPNWMFLSSFQDFRNFVFDNSPVQSFVHNGRGVWGSDFGSCAFVLQNTNMAAYQGSFLRLFEKPSSVAGNEELAIRFHSYPRFYTTNSEFKKIPGSPLAYWMSDNVKKVFEVGVPLGEISFPRKGNSTSDNNRFLRFWPEISFEKIGLELPVYDSNFRWIPYNKGGGFRKWYGHNSFLIDWKDQGAEIRKIPTAVIANESLFFTPGLTWGTVTVGDFSIRWFGHGFIFDNGGCCIFGADNLRYYLMALLNSVVFPTVLGSINPTVNFQSGEISKFPVVDDVNIKDKIDSNARIILDRVRADWDCYEQSWDFRTSPIVVSGSKYGYIKLSYAAFVEINNQIVSEVRSLEEENNRLFLNAYHLTGEISPTVSIEKITLTANPAYRYGGNFEDEELANRMRQDSIIELLSYAIGCVMGRYSLDEPGLIYAYSGNVGFDGNRYITFPVDADGIVPITDELWFEDEAANRVREFVRAVWGQDTIEENMAWLAESLGKKANETPDETIRRYLADKFFKDHVQTYKKRPIYWLFSSGKQGAFQALVYLHRYQEGTLARMRAEYVVPLTGKIQSRIEMLERDALSASSTAARNKINKDIEKLKKQHVELLSYDEKLRHYADMRIKLDLDDGVKVNYGKFGDLLDSVKAITGGSED